MTRRLVDLLGELLLLLLLLYISHQQLASLETMLIDEELRPIKCATAGRKIEEARRRLLGSTMGGVLQQWINYYGLGPADPDQMHEISRMILELQQLQ